MLTAADLLLMACGSALAPPACPCDVHVDRVARRLGLIQRPQTNWQTALELPEILKILDPTDPVRYDFALFELGVEGKM